MIQSSGSLFTQSLMSLWGGVVMYLPNIIIAIILVVLGFLIGGLLGRAISHLVNAAKVDAFLQKIGAMETLRKVSANYNSARYIGGLVKWFFIIVFFIAAVGQLGLTQVSFFLAQILAFIPSVIIAAIILVVGSVLADWASRVVRGTARAADMHASNFAAAVVKWAIWVFAIMVALSQVGIAAALINTIFIGLVAMLALAGGLAFGLGGRDHASRVLDGVSKMVSRD
jgi:hypothetical protein